VIDEADIWPPNNSVGRRRRRTTRIELLLRLLRRALPSPDPLDWPGAADAASREIAAQPPKWRWIDRSMEVKLSRWPFGGRDICELYKSIDVRRWHREGRLHAGHQFSWSLGSGGEPSGTIKVRSEVDAVVLMYRARSFLAAGWKPIEQRVPVTWTNCHFGGCRPWFTCSAHTTGRYCGRRVVMLYLAGELFACRRCCGLTYASRQKDPLIRNVSQSQVEGIYDAC
jgi:hypothetical protein